MDPFIRECTALDLGNGFLDTLANLADVDMTTEQAREVFRSRLRNGIRTYVALIDDQIVGTITLLVERKFIHRGGVVGHIEDVAVHPEYQKRGVASALVRHATEEARGLGCYKVILNCFDHLVAFYERLGFRRHDNGMRIDL